MMLSSFAGLVRKKEDVVVFRFVVVWGGKGKGEVTLPSDLA